MNTDVNKLMAAGKWQQAVNALRSALNEKPLDADIRFQLAFSLHESRQLMEALNHYLAVLGIDPKHVAARNNMGNLLLQLGKIDLAVDCFRKVLDVEPEHANAMFILGTFLSNTGKLKDAARLLRKAAKYNPDLPNVYSVLASTLVKSGHLDEGANAYHQSIKRKPDEANHNNLANIYNKQGRTKDAERQFRAALNYANGPLAAAIHSNIVLTMHYSDEYDEKALAAELSSWASCHETPLKSERCQLDNHPVPDKKLRIGYLSADFRCHPIGFFWLPVLTSHDPDRFETFCYSSTLRQDNKTNEFRAAATNWRDVAKLADGSLAEQVRRDKIDILVDLSGHTAGHRLLVLARRAAPVQIVAGGHFCSTGMTEVDYLVADKTHAPAGAEHEFTERLIHMPDSYTCYAPPPYAPQVTNLPAAGGNPLTFGCFNNLAKFSPRTIALWSKVLAAVPESRLLLRAKALSDRGTAERCRKLFENQGIDGTRIITGPGAPHKEFIGFYNDMDIALDTFPYSGGLTTLEALWMGVPVVTLPGDAFCGKHSAGHLGVAGLPELVADSPEKFVGIACNLANDRNRLASLRDGLRERLGKSALLDGKAYTHHLENAYRKAWQAWCAENGGQ